MSVLGPSYHRRPPRAGERLHFDDAFGLDDTFFGVSEVDRLALGIPRRR